MRQFATAGLALLGVVLLGGFTPFSRVSNVCPQCPPPPSDVLTLTNGFKVQANVVAQNEVFYVAERFGEYRAVMKNEVSQVEWKDKSGPNSLGTGDQILLQNGLVLHGAIVAEKPGVYLQIQVGQLKHAVWLPQIRAAYKGGRRYQPAGSAP